MALFARALFARDYFVKQCVNIPYLRLLIKVCYNSQLIVTAIFVVYYELFCVAKVELDKITAVNLKPFEHNQSLYSARFNFNGSTFFSLGPIFLTI